MKNTDTIYKSKIELEEKVKHLFTEFENQNPNLKIDSVNIYRVEEYSPTSLRPASLITDVSIKICI